MTYNLLPKRLGVADGAVLLASDVLEDGGRLLKSPLLAASAADAFGMVNGPEDMLPREAACVFSCSELLVSDGLTEPNRLPAPLLVACALGVWKFPNSEVPDGGGPAGVVDSPPKTGLLAGVVVSALLADVPKTFDPPENKLAFVLFGVENKLVEPFGSDT